MSGWFATWRWTFVWLTQIVFYGLPWLQGEMLPGLDGLEVCKRLRAASDVPILMLTAHTETSRVTAARDAGVSGFVRKPISARLLFDRISNVLTDTRMFVSTVGFFGPDRRFGQDPHYAGPLRRDTDKNEASGDNSLDVDDLRWSA